VDVILQTLVEDRQATFSAEVGCENVVRIWLNVFSSADFNKSAVFYVYCMLCGCIYRKSCI